MTQPGYPHDEPMQPMYPQPPAPPPPAGWYAMQPPTVPVAVPMPAAPEAPRRRGKLARRALLVALGLGACVGAAELVPFGLDKARQYTAGEVHDAFNAGRQAALRELQQLEVEGSVITLDAAIGVAGATLWATQNIFTPLARLMSLVGSNALNVLAGLLAQASGLLGHFGVDVSPLDHLRDTLHTWSAAMSVLPTALQQTSTTDLTSAQGYLEALRTKIAQEMGTPTPGATAAE